MKNFKTLNPYKILYFVACFVKLFQSTVQCSVSSLHEIQNNVYNQDFEIKRLKACFWNKGYFFDRTPRTFNEAKELCAYYNATIAQTNVKNRIEREKLLEMLGFNSSDTRFWMPLNKEKGGFTWLNGAKVNYTDVGWMDGEPNDKGGNEDCVHTNYKMDSVQDINDVPCDYHEPTLCEIKCDFYDENKLPERFHQKKK